MLTLFQSTLLQLDVKDTLHHLLLSTNCEIGMVEIKAWLPTRSTQIMTLHFNGTLRLKWWQHRFRVFTHAVACHIDREIKLHLVFWCHDWWIESDENYDGANIIRRICLHGTNVVGVITWPGFRFNISLSFCRYMDFHCNDKNMRRFRDRPIFLMRVPLPGNEVVK